MGPLGICNASDCTRAAKIKCLDCRNVAYCTKRCMKADAKDHRRNCFSKCLFHFNLYKYRLKTILLFFIFPTHNLKIIEQTKRKVRVVQKTFNDVLSDFSLRNTWFILINGGGGIYLQYFKKFLVLKYLIPLNPMMRTNSETL